MPTFIETFLETLIKVLISIIPENVKKFFNTKKRKPLMFFLAFLLIAIIALISHFIYIDYKVEKYIAMGNDQMAQYNFNSAANSYTSGIDLAGKRLIPNRATMFQLRQNLADAYIEMNNPNKALEFSNANQLIINQNYKITPQLTVLHYTQKGNINRYIYKYDEALKNYEIALKHIPLSLERGYLNYLVALNQSKVYGLKNDFDKAFIFAEDAKNIAEQVPDIELIDRARAYIQIGNILTKKQESSRAINILDQAKSILHSIAMDYSPECVDLYYYYSEISYLDDIYKAQEFIEESIRISESVYPKYHEVTMKSKIRYASILKDIGKKQDALSILEDIERNMPEATPMYASLKTSIGKVYMDLDNPEKALAMFADSHKILNSFLGEQNIETIMSRVDMCYYHFYLNDPTVIKELEEAQNAIESLLGTQNYYYARVLNNIGQFYLNNEQYSSAANCFYELQTIYQNIYHEGHSETIKAKVDYAWCKIDQNDIGILNSIESGLKFYTQKYGKHHNSTLNFFKLYCEALVEFQEYEIALPYLIEYDSILKTYSKPIEFAYLAKSDLAFCYYQLGAYDNARAFYEDLMNMHIEYNAKYSRKMIKNMYYYADTCIILHEYETALEYLEKANALHEKVGIVEDTFTVDYYIINAYYYQETNNNDMYQVYMKKAHELTKKLFGDNPPPELDIFY